MTVSAYKAHITSSLAIAPHTCKLDIGSDKMTDRRKRLSLPVPRVARRLDEQRDLNRSSPNLTTAPQTHLHRNTTDRLKLKSVGPIFLKWRTKNKTDKKSQQRHTVYRDDLNKENTATVLSRVTSVSCDDLGVDNIKIVNSGINHGPNTTAENESGETHDETPHFSQKKGSELFDHRADAENPGPVSANGRQRHAIQAREVEAVRVRRHGVYKGTSADLKVEQVQQAGLIPKTPLRSTTIEPAPQQTYDEDLHDKSDDADIAGTPHASGVPLEEVGTEPEADSSCGAIDTLPPVSPLYEDLTPDSECDDAGEDPLYETVGNFEVLEGSPSDTGRPEHGEPGYKREHGEPPQDPRLRKETEEDTSESDSSSPTISLHSDGPPSSDEEAAAPQGPGGSIPTINLSTDGGGTLAANEPRISKHMNTAGGCSMRDTSEDNYAKFMPKDSYPHGGSDVFTPVMQHGKKDLTTVKRRYYEECIKTQQLQQELLRLQINQIKSNSSS